MLGGRGLAKEPLLSSLSGPGQQVDGAKALEVLRPCVQFGGLQPCVGVWREACGGGGAMLVRHMRDPAFLVEGRASIPPRQKPPNFTAYAKGKERSCLVQSWVNDQRVCVTLILCWLLAGCVLSAFLDHGVP